METVLVEILVLLWYDFFLLETRFHTPKIFIQGELNGKDLS